jgi:DNA-binding XRE family transcriptional regulator
MECQDWTPVVIRREPTKDEKAERKAARESAVHAARAAAAEEEPKTPVGLAREKAMRIQQARLAAGMKQNDVAKALSITPKMYADIEAGKVKPSGAIMNGICRLLHVTFS